jgi:hypothetical protein
MFAVRTGKMRKVEVIATDMTTEASFNPFCALKLRRLSFLLRAVEWLTGHEVPGKITVFTTTTTAFTTTTTTASFHLLKIP